MDPRETRISEHFLLSDFLGNHSVYSRGIPNLIDPEDRELPLKIGNARALCGLLETILEAHGPLSIGYGYITPSTSKKIVTYQDPAKPSHHQWNLGAAADICVHRWVNGDPDDDTFRSSPIALAHSLSRDGLAYSRLISYSESPYLCLAASSREIQEGRPRLALYENRFLGRKGKPLYIKSPSAAAKERHQAQQTLDHGWRGAGYPTYHGGGKQQYQHVRTSRYTMLIDWLFDLKLISIGRPNLPGKSMSMFHWAGDAYDFLIDALQVPRLSIIQGFVSPTNGNYASGNVWTEKRAKFVLSPPESLSVKQKAIAAHDLTWNRKLHADALYIDKTGNIEVTYRDD